jgi:hypothetical protein
VLLPAQARRLVLVEAGMHGASRATSERLQHFSVKNAISSCIVSKLAL